MSFRSVKRASSRGEEPSVSKRRKGDVEDVQWQPRPNNDLKISTIYNRSAPEAPAELFRKDLISAMKLPDSEPLAADEYWVITDPWKQEWERGVQVPVNPDSLPEPAFTVIHNQKLLNTSCRGSKFKLPQKYVRLNRDGNFNPCEHSASNAMSRAETVCAYDMDTCDAAWLRALNGERARAGVQPLHEEQLERVIEELEVRCWDKIQAIMKSEEGLGIEYDENVICDVCRSPDSEEGNEMVFCDSCNICVHQACYGITAIPSGQWLCSPCASGASPLCVLCPNLGGAMKCTPSGHKWAHVSCVLWIPEVSIGCAEKMEPITKISAIPSSRWSLICILCRERTGACIQCSVKTCKTAYHVTCAFKYGLEMRAIIEDENAEDGVKLRSYCQRHSVTTKFERYPASGSEEDESKRKRRKDMTSEEKSQARAIRLHEIEAEFDRHVSIKDISTHLLDVDPDGIQYMYNYWKLKRKAGHNRPLLPPKTDDSDMLMHRQEQADIDKKRMFVQLRQDLERVRNLCYMVSRREKLSRSFIRMREQTFHKQAAILSTGHALTPAVADAVIEANHGPSIYDRLFSYKRAMDHTDDFDLILSLIGGGDVEDETKNLNGLIRRNKPADSNKRLYFNGSARRRSSYYDLSSGAESLSGIQIQRPLSKFRRPIYSSTDEELPKESVVSSRRTMEKRMENSRLSREQQSKSTVSKNKIDSSSEEEVKKKGWQSPRSRTLRQMEKEMTAKALSGSESDELMPMRTTKSHKLIANIYSDSDLSDIKNEDINEDKSSNATSDSQHPFRTKAAVKEFVPLPKVVGKNTSPVKKYKVGESDDDKRMKDYKPSKSKDYRSDLIVPQRQAAKKAFENMRSNTNNVKPKEQNDLVECKTLQPLEEGKIKSKQKSKEKRKENKDNSPKSIKRETKSHGSESFDFEKDDRDNQDVLAYVPQRQAAKKAAEHIKSGLSKVPESVVDDTMKKKESIMESSKKSPKKDEDKQQKSLKASVSSLSSSTSSCSSSSSDRELDPKTVKEIAHLSRSIRPLDSPPTKSIDLPFLDKGTKVIYFTNSSSDSESCKDSPVKTNTNRSSPRGSRQKKSNLPSGSSKTASVSPRKTSDKKLQAANTGLLESGLYSSSSEREKSSRTINPLPRSSARTRTRSITAGSGNILDRKNSGQRESTKEQSVSPQTHCKDTKESRKSSKFSSTQWKTDKKLKYSKEVDISNTVTKLDSQAVVKKEYNKNIQNEANLTKFKSNSETGYSKKNRDEEKERSKRTENLNNNTEELSRTHVLRNTSDDKFLTNIQTKSKVTESRKCFNVENSNTENTNKSMNLSSVEDSQRKFFDKIAFDSDRRYSDTKKSSEANSSKKIVDLRDEKMKSLDIKETRNKRSAIDPLKKGITNEPSSSFYKDLYDDKIRSLDTKDTEGKRTTSGHSKKSFTNEPDISHKDLRDENIKLLETKHIESKESSSFESSKKMNTRESILVDHKDAHSIDSKMSKSTFIPPSYSNRSIFSLPTTKDTGCSELFDFGNDILAVDETVNDDGFSMSQGNEEIMKATTLTFFSSDFFKADSTEDRGVPETLDLIEKLKSKLDSKKSGNNANESIEIDNYDTKESETVLTPFANCDSYKKSSNTFEQPKDKILRKNARQSDLGTATGLLSCESYEIAQKSEISEDEVDVEKCYSEKDKDTRKSPTNDTSNNFTLSDVKSENQFKAKSLETTCSSTLVANELENNEILSKQAYLLSQEKHFDSKMERSEPEVSSIGISMQHKTPPSIVKEPSESIQSFDNENTLQQHPECTPVSSPYSNIQQRAKWSESDLMPARRSSTSSATSETSSTSHKRDEIEHPKTSDNLQVNVSSNILQNMGYPSIPLFPTPSCQTSPYNQFSSEASQFVQLFPPVTISSEVPLRSLGTSMYSQNLPYQESNTILTQIPKIPSEESMSFSTSCSAAFTTCSHNMAMTSTMISPLTPKPATDRDSPNREGDQDVTSPNSFSMHESSLTSIDEYSNTNMTQHSQIMSDKQSVTTIVSPTQGKKSPSKSSKVMSKYLPQQLKSPCKSPNKSPRQNDLVKGSVSRRGISKSNRGSRSRGRPRGKSQNIHPFSSMDISYYGIENTIHTNLRGTVYDLDFDEDIANDSMGDLKSMRDRRRSTDVHDRKCDSFRDSSQSPKFTSPTQQQSSKRSYTTEIKEVKPPPPVADLPAAIETPSSPATLRSSVSETVQPFTDIVEPVLPGPVDMRTYSGAFEPSNTDANHLLGAFASGTADQQLPEIDEDAELSLHSALIASSSKSQEQLKISPKTIQTEINERTIEESPQIIHDMSTLKVSLTDPRNQLKVKIKGPFLDANYSASCITPAIQQPILPVIEQSSGIQVLGTPSAVGSVTSAMLSGTSSLRRMRKKELLRQYCTQDMNMDDPGAGNTVSQVSSPPPVSSFSRNVITIPKAVASMTSIPTREDYKAVVDANMEKKRRKTSGGLSRELRHLDPQNDDESQDMPNTSFTMSTPSQLALSYKRRGRIPKPTPIPNVVNTPTPPKIKIKIGNYVTSEQGVNSDTSRYDFQFRPPKKRLTSIPKPSVEDLRRESMKFRRKVMAEFDGGGKEKKKRGKSEKRKKKRKKHTPEMHVVDKKSESSTKLIIRFRKKDDNPNSENVNYSGEEETHNQPSEPPAEYISQPPAPSDPFEYDPTAPDPLALDSPAPPMDVSTAGLGRSRSSNTCKVSPIRLKLARGAGGSGYVMKDSPGVSAEVPTNTTANESSNVDPLSSATVVSNKHCEVR